MALGESESDQEQAQGRHFPDIHPLGECANRDGQLTPPGISPAPLPDIQPMGHREFLRIVFAKSIFRSLKSTNSP